MRWWERRRATPVENDGVDDVGVVLLQLVRSARIWEPDSSGEEILFVRTRDGDSQVEITMRDVGAQTTTWQYYSSDELESEISFRLSDDAFAMLHDQLVLLHADYNKRHQYKIFGATYNGETQRWSLRPGRDLRHVFVLFSRSALL